MDVVEVSAEGLSRQFKVTIPASDLEARLDDRLEGMKGQVRLKGFRPGKVPVSFLKKTYGKSLMPEILEEAVTQTSQETLSERDLKPAMQPKIEFEGELEDVLQKGADLTFSMSVELLPEFEVMDLKTIKLEKPVTEVPDSEIEEALTRIGEQTRTFSDKQEGASAADGDEVTIDFEGRVDGELFEGGAGEDMAVVIGSGRLIPGFEDQLIGAKRGEVREVKVTFPDDYAEESLKGKDAVFAVTVKGVKAPNEIVLDDELAKRMGMESLDALKGAVKQQMDRDYANMSRAHVKRRLLDALDEGHSFDLPPGMVEAEFEQIWQQVQHEIEHHGRDPQDEGKSEDELKDEYRKIAERRVRLGLVLAEVGRVNEVDVTQEELTRALQARAGQFPPEQRNQVFEFYRRPEAMAELRAPIFEEKVVDFILELADVSDVTVSKDELFKSPEDDLPGGHAHAHDHDHDH